MHLISHQVSLEVIDLGKKGDSVGDQVVESTVELQNGQRVGRGLLNCVAVTVTAQVPDVVCHGAIVFGDGQVEFQARPPSARRSRSPSPAAPAATRTSVAS